MCAAGIISDHPSEGAAAVGGRVGTEREMVFLGFISQRVEDDAGLHSRESPIRQIEIDGKSFLLETALRSQFALVHAFLAEKLAEPKLREQLKNEGATSVGNTPKEFAAFVREDIERWAPLVKSSGATPN